MGQSSTLIYAINPDSAVEFNSVRDVQFTLQKTLTTSIYLNVLYGKAKISKTTALLKAYAAASGLQTGTSWTCHAVVINALPGHNQFTCEVLGTEGWYLLGFNIYNRTMHFTNTFHLPK